MNRRELGRTGVLIPEIGLGAWDYRGGIEPLRAGLDAGALFIDTAESYGTEPIVGQAIQGRRSEVFLATKVSPHHLRRRDVLKCADASLQRLGVDYIDLYQVHEPSYTIPIGETMAALEELVVAGKVRFIGVSNFTVKQMESARKALTRSTIVSNQVRYNLIDRTIESGVLPYCQKNGITVIAYTPLARGLSFIEPHDPEGRLGEVARAVGRTPIQVLLNWCLSREGVVAIPKGNSREHILENCGASGWSLSKEQVALLDSRVRYRRRSQLEVLLRRFTPAGPKRLVKSAVRLLRRR